MTVGPSEQTIRVKRAGTPPVAIGLIMPIPGMKSPSWPQLMISCIDPFVVSKPVANSSVSSSRVRDGLCANSVTFCLGAQVVTHWSSVLDWYSKLQRRSLPEMQATALVRRHRTARMLPCSLLALEHYSTGAGAAHSIGVGAARSPLARRRKLQDLE